MADTRWTQMPLLAEGQDDKELLHNEALWRADVMENRAFFGFVAALPGGAIDGDTYIVEGGVHNDEIAFWLNGAWEYIVPRDGWVWYSYDSSPPGYFNYTEGASPAWAPFTIASVDASGVTYTPASNANWSGGTDPGDVDNALDQLAARRQPIIIACSDETTPLTAGTLKVTFRMPYAFKLTEIPRASLSTAQATGGILTVDVNESGSSILSTKLTIDNTEKTSTTAATPAVMSDSDLANDAEITIDIDSLGDGTATGLKVTLIGFPT